MNQAVILYNALAFSLMIGGLYWLGRFKSRPFTPAVVSCVIVLIILTFLVAFYSSAGNFGKVQLFT